MMNLGKKAGMGISMVNSWHRFVAANYQHGTWMEMGISYHVGNEFMSIPSILLPIKEMIKDEIRRNS